MMNRLFVSTMLLFTVVSTYSQKIDEEDPLYARAGFKAGINYATIMGDMDALDARVRMHLGAVIEYPISRKLFVQGELLYSAQGYTREVSGNKEKISLNYLTLPIVAKFYITEFISLESGPQFSVLSTVRNDDLEDDDAFFNSFNSFDFSWALGAGYRFENGLFFQLRYNLGVTNINDTDVFNATNKNSIAQLSIGYLFKTKNNRRIIQQ